MDFQNVLAPTMEGEQWALRPHNDFPTIRIVSNGTEGQDVSQLPDLGNSSHFWTKPNRPL